MVSSRFFGLVDNGRNSYLYHFVSELAAIRLSTTGAAERQDPGFLIGPRNKKKGKKARPLKFFIHRSKLQTSISHEIQPTEAGACLRRLPLHPRRFCSAN
jgi:hypothetical protein